MSLARKHLTLEQRIEVIELNERGKSQRRLARMFKCGKTQINTIIKDRDAIFQEWKDFTLRGVKRRRAERFPDVNGALLEWYEETRTKGIRITGHAMQEKALEIADALGAARFSASNGWLGKFMARYGIVLRRGATTSEDEELSSDTRTNIDEQQQDKGSTASSSSDVDPESLVCKLEPCDDVSNHYGKGHLIGDAHGSNSESEEKCPPVDINPQAESTLSAHQTLKHMHFLMKNSETMKNATISSLFFELRHHIEKEAVSQKSEATKNYFKKI